MTLEDAKQKVTYYDGLIVNNYTNLSGFLEILKIDINSEVETKLAELNPAPTVMDTVELDANWWKENAESLGWTKDGDYYVYVDPDTGDTYRYNPKNSRLKVTEKGKGTYDCTCKFYLNGELADAKETVTLLKCYENGEPVTTDVSTKPQLVIAPDLTGDEDDRELTALRAFYASKFGDMLLNSAGNSNDVSHEICGFSMGGVEASLMVSGRLGDKFVGYYDEATFVNITPSFQYTDAQKENMRGMTINIVQNYHNIHGAGDNRRDGAMDFYTNKRGNPHLDGLTSIPDATINLYVPDTSKDNYKVVTKMVAYAEGLGRDNLNVIQYSVPDSDLSLYGDGRDINAHGKGRTVLVPRYLAGDLTPIE